jgi:hypothetical protein
MQEEWNFTIEDRRQMHIEFHYKKQITPNMIINKMKT